MEQQRERARTGGSVGAGDGPPRGRCSRSSARRPRRASSATRTSAPEPASPPPRRSPGAGEALVKLEESPFYAEGGGQVADRGRLRWDGERGRGPRRLPRRHRPGACGCAAERPPRAGNGSRPRSPAVDRHATMRNHTATHLLHAALRERLGTHVRQAGSAVRPDKLRFDFTHGARLTPRGARRGRATGSTAGSRRAPPVRAIEMDRAEAERLGAMALFGEKYGDWVRVVEVEGVSRELCGGTHVANTAEVGIFEIVSEGSSASNVRRIEAVTGPAAIDLFRDRSDRARSGRRTPGAPRGRGRRGRAPRRAPRRARGRRPPSAAPPRQATEPASCAEQPTAVGGIARRRRLARRAPRRARLLLGLAHGVRRASATPRSSLGATTGGRSRSSACFSPAAVERGLSAADVVREAARSSVAAAAASPRSRRPAAGTPRAGRGAGGGRERAGAAWLGCDEDARHRPWLGALWLRGLRPDRDDRHPARPDLPAGPAPRSPLAAERGAELIVVGLPVGLDGRRASRPRAARAFAGRVGALVDVPVETYDERLTTRMAAASPARRLARRRGLPRGRPSARLLPDVGAGAAMSDGPDENLPPVPPGRPVPRRRPRGLRARAPAAAARGEAPRARPAASRSRRGSAARSTVPRARAARRSSRQGEGREPTAPETGPEPPSFRAPRPPPPNRRPAPPAPPTPAGDSGRLRRRP